MIRYRVEYFSPKEFICPCCRQGLPSSLLVLSLDSFRRAWGKPIRVNSGFRCEKHNREVGGAVPTRLSPGSRHLLGLAADIAPMDGELFGPFETLARLFWGRLENWELKIYSRFIHVAVPRGEEKYPWDGSLILVNVKSA